MFNKHTKLAFYHGFVLTMENIIQLAVKSFLINVLTCSVSRFDTRTLRTQRQQQYVRTNGYTRSVVCLLFAVVL